MQAYKTKELIPKSDLFVMEEKLWTKGGLKSHTDMGINLLTFQVSCSFPKIKQPP